MGEFSDDINTKGRQDTEDVNHDNMLSGDENGGNPSAGKKTAGTVTLLESLTESDLDKISAQIPKGYASSFGTSRQCLQFVADHWYMHRGQLADSRRTAGLNRMWL